MKEFVINFIFPALVALFATFASFLTTYYLNKKQQKNERDIRRLDFLTNITNEFSQILVVLEKLQDDIANNSYFSIRTILSANPSYTRLKQLRDEVVLIESTDDREKIINTINITVNFLEDVDNLEQFLLNETQRHMNMKDKVMQELRNIQLELLNVNMYLDKAYSIQFVKEKENKADTTKKESEITELETQKKEAVEKLLENLVQDLQESEKKLNQNYEDGSRRRLVYTTKITDIQNKIRDIHTLINNLQKKQK